jgi:2-hydroxychromene-2-carboxylate isomerase
MGELIVLAERRADRSRPRRASRPAFFFDLACPFSYLAVERVERLLGEVEWVPVARIGQPDVDVEELCARAELRATELRLPLVWPDRFPAGTPSALRAAARATHDGSGSRFALAAARLAFCGGFDLEDPEVLAEAAAAAGVTLEDCLAAAGDREIDAELEATARGLLLQGVTELPAVRLGARFFDGEHRLSEAVLALRAPMAPNVVGASARVSALSDGPLAPVS